MSTENQPKNRILNENRGCFHFPSVSGFDPGMNIDSRDTAQYLLIFLFPEIANWTRDGPN